MKKIQYNGSSKILNGIVTKVNLIIDKLVVDVKVNGTSVVVVNEEGEREADIDLSLADQNVKQSPTTSSDNSDYRVLLSKSANDTEETDISRKDTNFKYNPSTGNLQTTKLNGNTVPSGSGNDTLAKLSDIPEAQTVATGSVFGALSFDGTDKIVKLTADRLEAGQDANDLKNSAVYYITSANEPLNTPAAFNNGFMIVLRYSSNIVKQIVFRQGTINSNDHQTYFRTYTESGWSKWHQFNTGEFIGGVENTDVASRAYAVNELMNQNGGVFRVTQAIASGGAITNNTNVVATTISDELVRIISSIPTALSQLSDDQTHRLVSDTEKSTWNGKAELTDVDKAELNTWNLIRQPYFHGSGTSSGTTRTVNADGSVTFTGTATATYNFNLKRYTQEWKLPKGTYRISGCPSGGSASTYFIRVAKYTTSQTNLADDYGDGATFTLTEESVMQINATVVNGYAIQGSLTFKPFIVPYQNVTWFENNILGAKNLLKYPYENSYKVHRAVTFSDYDGKGAIKANGTNDNTGVSWMRIEYGLKLKEGSYIFTGGISSDYYFGIRSMNSSGTETVLGEDTGSGFNITVSSSDAENLSYNIYVYVARNKTADNVIYYPMLRLASIADNTYVPYAQTNRQLTINKLELSDNAILGAKNLVPFPYYQMKGSVRSVQYEYLPNGGYHLNGTCDSAANGYVYFTSNQYATAYSIDGSYRTMLIATGTGVENLIFGIAKNVNGTRSALFTSIDANVIQDFSYTGKIDIEVGIKKGTTVDVYVYPILVLSTETDLSWTPYAATNYTLTTQKADYKQIADVEFTDTASRAYAIGEYMIWRGGFYVVRADIASGGAITLNTNVQATDLGSEVKKSKIWGNENIATIPNSSSSSKVYVTTSAYATEIYVQRMNIRSTSLGINETGYCSVTIPILPSMPNNFFVFMFRGDIDNKLYDGRLNFKKDSNGVYGYVSKVYQDGVLKSANDIEADIVVFEKS